MRGFAAIGLQNPKSPVNIGAVLRACGCYEASLLVTTGTRYHRTAPDTGAAYRHLPLLQVEDLHDAVPFDCVPIAVDILPDAVPLPHYHHPERAFYIFGPEDGTLGKAVTSWCRDIVYIPTIRCLNLAMTVNTVLYDRMSKRSNSFKEAGDINDERPADSISFVGNTPFPGTSPAIISRRNNAGRF